MKVEFIKLENELLRIRRMIEAVHNDVRTLAEKIPGYRNTQLNELDAVESLVESSFGVDPLSLAGPSKESIVVTARHIAWLLAHERTTMSSTSLAHWLGRKDHGTVLSALRKVEHRINYDSKLRLKVEQLREVLCSQTTKNQTAAPGYSSGAASTK